MRRFLALLLILVSVNVKAQDFKILFLNTETIRIGGNDLRQGYTFNSTDQIKWSDAKQAMKVLSLTDSKQFILVSRDFEQKKLKSLKEYLVQTNRFSTRGLGHLSSVERQIGETLYVCDTTRVAINYVPDESEYFFLSDGESRFELGYEDGQLVFYPFIWEGRETMIIDLFFHFADGEEENVIEELEIVPVDQRIP